MSQASDLLNSLSADDVTVYANGSETEKHIVIGEDRIITVPESLRRIAVQHDHNVETVTFDCPRYWDGIDLSTMAIYINYLCPNKTLGAYIAQNVTIDESDSNVMHFDWTITRNITVKNGKLSFLVCIKNVDSEGNEINHWNSELNTDMYVSEGLETTEALIETVPDLLTQILLLNELTLTRASVYVGSGDMPEWANVQIDPDGEAGDAPGSGGGADISLGISGASAGQVAKVKTVDASGTPTEWEAGDAASGGDGWTEIGELTVEGTEFIISDYTDGVITVTPDNGIYPSVGRGYVIRKPDYSAYINACLVATETEGKFTLVNLDNAVYTPSEDLTQYVIDATDAWGELAFSNLPSFSYLKIGITTPLLSSHGSRSTISISGKIQFTIGTSCSNLTGGAVEMIVETDESPVSGKDYVKVSFKGKKPDRSNGYDVIDFVNKSTSDIIKIGHYNGLMVSGTNVKMWGRN